MNLTDCMFCPPGMYCEGTGLDYPSGWCDEGFFCTGGSYAKRPFNVGVLVNNRYVIIIIIAHICNAPNTLFLGAVHIITPVIGFRLTRTQCMRILHSMGSIPASRHFKSATCSFNHINFRILPVTHLTLGWRVANVD